MAFRVRLYDDVDSQLKCLCITVCLFYDLLFCLHWTLQIGDRGKADSVLWQFIPRSSNMGILIHGLVQRLAKLPAYLTGDSGKYYALLAAADEETYLQLNLSLRKVFIPSVYR